MKDTHYSDKLFEQFWDILKELDEHAYDQPVEFYQNILTAFIFLSKDSAHPGSSRNAKYTNPINAYSKSIKQVYLISESHITI